MTTLAGTCLAVLALGLLLRRLRQPHVVAYLIAGVVLGPHVLGVIGDQETLSRLGAVGVVLLLFFAGMDSSPRRLVAGWRASILGTLVQVVVSVLVVLALGFGLGWPLSRSILLGFVISMSSTAIVVKLLGDWNELDGDLGRDVLGITVAQDLAVIPMLIAIGFLAGESLDAWLLARQLLGVVIVAVLVVWVFSREEGELHLPLARWLGDDREMEVFAALLLAFGLALVTAVLGLSTALGAFVAGMVVNAARETHWVHDALQPFRVLLLAFFFVSVGLLLDLDFLRQHWIELSLLVGAVLSTNTFINAAIMKALGHRWRESLYGGALLSQIGEFSFVLGAVGLQAGIISDYGHQLTLALIALTLLIGPAWIVGARTLLRPGAKEEVEATPPPAT